MFFVESSVGLALNLVALQELFDEVFNLDHFDSALVVGVNCIVDVLGHLSELVDVDKDVSQVLDRLLVVHLQFLWLSIFICHFLISNITFIK